MKLVGILGSLWGALGVFALIGFATARLAPRAWEAIESGLTPLQWGVLAVWVAFMAHAEGYKGFQKSFSPRTAARIHFLSSKPNVLHSLLAPFFSMGYFHATKRTKIVAFSLTFGIALLVMLVRLLPQPWRGIVDAGVVVGLTWGMLSLAIYIIRAFAKGKPDASPEVPEGNSPETTAEKRR